MRFAGLAALLVLAFHLFRSSPMTGELDAARAGRRCGDARRESQRRRGLLRHLGFVITWTTRRLGSGLGEAGNYSLRRQLRLDPPYYVVILVVVAAALAERWVPGLDYRTITPGQVSRTCSTSRGSPVRSPSSPLPGHCATRSSSTSSSCWWPCARRWTGGARATTAPLLRPSSRLIFAALAVVSFILPFTGYQRRAVVHRVLVDVLRRDVRRVVLRARALLGS